MKEIKLNHGFVTQVDDEDFEYLNQWKWRAVVCRHTIYAARTLWIKGENRSVTVHLHRLIMNTPRELQVDHIDHNGLNNQKSNMRNCTEAQNHKNTRKGNSIRGVSWISKLNKWRAYISVNHKQVWLGSYFDVISAAKARDNAAKKYYGEFANLNFKE